MLRRDVRDHVWSAVVSRLSAGVRIAAVLAGSGTAGASNASQGPPAWEGRGVNSILPVSRW
jgi:hypothetical protein